MLLKSCAVAQEASWRELARRGVSREQAYEWVQRNAMRSHEEGRDFKQLLLADPDVTRAGWRMQPNAILPVAGKGNSDWSYAWIPVAGPIVGGVLAAFLYKALWPV